MSASMPSSAEPVPQEYDQLCEGCGYSLIGLMENRCPECGQEFDPTQLPLARIPWLYRARLGKNRAYWRTVRQIVFHPKTFAAELCRPARICVEDARLFRRRTIWLALFPSLGIAAVMIAFEIWRTYTMLLFAGSDFTIVKIVERALLGLIALALGGWFFLKLATDLPTFIWRGLPTSPDDLAPIHSYASAPIAVSPPVLLAMLAVSIPVWRTGAALDRSTVIAWCAIGSLIPFLFWRTAVVFMNVANHGKGRLFWLMLYLPIHWLLAAFMSLMIFSLIFGFVSDLLR